MAGTNIFQGAKKVKEETEEVLKALEDVKELRKDLDNLKDALEGAERLKGKLERIEKTLSNLEGRAKAMVDNQVEIVIDSWKLWALYLPAIVFFASLVGAGYIYFTTIRGLKEQNEELKERMTSIYYAQLLDNKYWYDKKNQSLFLQEYKWIEEQIKQEKKNAKK